MRDRLPDIKIKIKENPREFLEKMQLTALKTKFSHVEFHKDFLGQGLDILSLNFAP